MKSKTKLVLFFSLFALMMLILGIYLTAEESKNEPPRVFWGMITLTLFCVVILVLVAYFFAYLSFPRVDDDYYDPGAPRKYRLKRKREQRAARKAEKRKLQAGEDKVAD